MTLRPPPARLARALDLFLAGAVLVDVPLAAAEAAAGVPWPGADAWLGATLALFFVHAAASIYDGGFRGWRRATWLLLVGAWVGAEAWGLLHYVLPWGQLSFFAAAWMTRALGSVPGGDALVSPLWEHGGSALVWFAALPPLALPAALLLDLIAMHRSGSRRRAVLAALATGALAEVAARLALPAGQAAGGIGAGGAPFSIVPAWFDLAPFAVLRAVPDKRAGLALMFAVLLLPALAPWLGADRCRTGPARGAFRRLFSAWIAACMTLAWAGAQPAEDALVPARVASLAYAAFFALVPLLARAAPRSAAAHHV